MNSAVEPCSCLHCMRACLHYTVFFRASLFPNTQSSPVTRLDPLQHLHWRPPTQRRIGIALDHTWPAPCPDHTPRLIALQHNHSLPPLDWQAGDGSSVILERKSFFGHSSTTLQSLFFNLSLASFLSSFCHSSATLQRPFHHSSITVQPLDRP